MENKYFTPDIEDICIGYELEWKCKIRNQDWEKTTCDTDLISIIYDEYEHSDFEEPYNEQFRVPYLTKEQIKAEGWEYKNRSTDLWFEHKEIFLREDGYHLENIKLQYGLHDYRLKISFVYVGDSEESTNAYLGECKDINTFRKIIKLLGI